jgi:hypothetical protein
MKKRKVDRDRLQFRTLQSSSPEPSARMASESLVQPAHQIVIVGEVARRRRVVGVADDCRRRNIEVAPGRQDLWIEVRGADGKWQAQGQVIVR